MIIFDENAPRKFTREVLKHYQKYHHSTYVNSVLAIAEKWNIAPEAVKTIIEPSLKERLKKEGIELNILPKEPKVI